MDTMTQSEVGVNKQSLVIYSSWGTHAQQESFGIFYSENAIFCRNSRNLTNHSEHLLMQTDVPVVFVLQCMADPMCFLYTNYLPSGCARPHCTADPFNQFTELNLHLHHGGRPQVLCQEPAGFN